MQSDDDVEVISMLRAVPAIGRGAPARRTGGECIWASPGLVMG